MPSWPTSAGCSAPAKKALFSLLLNRRRRARRGFPYHLRFERRVTLVSTGMWRRRQLHHPSQRAQGQSSRGCVFPLSNWPKLCLSPRTQHVPLRTRFVFSVHVAVLYFAAVAAAPFRSCLTNPSPSCLLCSVCRCRQARKVQKKTQHSHFGSRSD